MRVLLDTHVLLWALAGGDRLQDDTRAVLIDGRTQVMVSAVSAWEITIKKALGKLVAPDDLPQQLEANRFRELPVSVTHALAVGQLPPRHNDPFDRLLIAQALVEDLVLVTADQQVAAYEVATMPG